VDLASLSILLVRPSGELVMGGHWIDIDFSTGFLDFAGYQMRLRYPARTGAGIG